MIDDLIPFLIFVGVALINLIKTAIERGGAKSAPQPISKKNTSSSKKPINTLDDFLEEISEQFSNNEKIDNQYQKEIILEDTYENDNLSSAADVNLDENEKKEEEILKNIQKETLGTAIKSIPNALLGANTIKTPAIPLLPNTKKGNLIFPLQDKKTFKNAIIANIIFSSPKAYDMNFENTNMS